MEAKTGGRSLDGSDQVVECVVERNSCEFEIISLKQMCSCGFHTTSIGIRALTYPSLITNRRDGYHPNDDKVEDAVLTRAEFQQFCEENQQELQQVVATLLARKSFYRNNN